MKALDLKKTYGTGTASCYEKYFPRFNSKAYRIFNFLFTFKNRPTVLRVSNSFLLDTNIKLILDPQHQPL